jgi:flavin-dependent thymidylate synthase
MGSSEVARFADVAMFEATPLSDDKGQVHPRVTLISMTPDPLRVMAAAAEMYGGGVIHNASRVPRPIAEEWFADMTRTKLKAPLEFINLHFLIEGVSRAFTHQLVRQRTAAYVQESQRFAVKTNARWEVVEPPSLYGLPDDHPWREVWNATVDRVAAAYNQLVNAGMPAEDARGLLPTNIGTRVHYHTNLRNLAEHAGNRLCTQAQFEWRQVWAEIIRAVKTYGPAEDSWQQEMIAQLFLPICFLTGKCEFMAVTDRHCSIRSRVNEGKFEEIRPQEWLADPTAARKAP